MNNNEAPKDKGNFCFQYFDTYICTCSAVLMLHLPTLTPQEFLPKTPTKNNAILS
jgi:hypothetical protein